MKTPTNNKDLQLLLGKINYYGRLLENRTEILAPLYNCNNAKEFNWTTDRKAVAIILDVTKFYDSVYARKFILRTDNKPLSRVFSPNKAYQEWQPADCKIGLIF